MLIWVVATATATGLAWAGVRSVVTDVAAPLPAATAAAVEVPPTVESTDPTSTAPDAARTRTFELRGGTATVRFGPESVQVLGAVPAAGYTVDVESEDRGTRVRFESADHRSRLHVWWQDGPRYAIDEGGRGDDDAERRHGDDDGHDDGDPGGDD